MHRYLRGWLSSTLIWSCTLWSCTTLQDSTSSEQADSVDAMVGAELAIAEDFLNKGNAERAWTNLRPLLEQFPKNPDVLTLAGLSLLALQNHARAVQLLEQAYQLKTTAAVGLNLSSAYIAEGHFDRAEALLKQLLVKKDPYSYKERFWHNLAFINERRGNESQAIAGYKQAIKENPTYYLSHLQLARIYGKRENKSKLAIHYYQLAHRFCPVCFDPVEELAQISLENNEPQRAIELLQAYLHNEENSPEHRQKAQQQLQAARAMQETMLPLSLR